MKEYMPGQGSYKVEEAGALTGIGMTYNVDDHWGTLVFDRDDVNIAARGVDIVLSSRFNSDHLYSTYIPKVSKSDGPKDQTERPVPVSLMTLPAGQTNFYRIAHGWSWKLPFVLLGVANAFKFSLGDGRIFDLLAAITREAWGGVNGGEGNHSWTEGYEVTCEPEAVVYPSGKGKKTRMSSCPCPLRFLSFSLSCLIIVMENSSGIHSKLVNRIPSWMVNKIHNEKKWSTPPYPFVFCMIHRQG